MTGASVIFSPLLPWPAIWVAAALALAFVALALWRGLSGWWLRALAAAALIGALTQPALQREDRRPLSDIVILVVDRSASQSLPGRPEQTAAAVARVSAEVAALPETELRVVELGDGPDDTGTRAMTALAQALAEEPRARVAGAILITDGQVHDMEAAPALPAPLNVLMTGRDRDWDRRVAILSAPAFGIIGEEAAIRLRVEDQGQVPPAEAGGFAQLSVTVDGGESQAVVVPVNTDIEVPLRLDHGGTNVVQFAVATAEGELTDRNNMAVVEINGVRDRLRVLLVSGEPHAGERTWRNLLKSDSAVDLVHFTILRPPEKQDGTPINQLSLIAFPTRELFVQKIDEFDLIIFDRYKRRNVLPLLYFDNIVRYVRDGGAILIAGGPEFGESPTLSIAGPLRELLPAAPTGRTLEGPFKPKVSSTGLRHPVTRGLDGWNEKDPEWGHWFRTVAADNVVGETVMTGKDDEPLIVLNHFGEGRVALYLSDQAWLWARGFDGGGPYVQLLRRTAHWLMKEPELDEERLVAESEGRKLVITRQTLGEDAGEARITGPSGNEFSLPFRQQAPGLWRAEAEVPDYGLYTAVDGNLRALTHVGPPNPREFAEVVSTTAALAPVLEAGRGSAVRADADAMPRIVPVRVGAPASGDGWIGLENTRASVLTGINRVPLFSGLLGLAILLLAMAAMWAREGSRS